jgi:hypothetical protein
MNESTTNYLSLQHYTTTLQSIRRIHKKDGQNKRT